MSLDHNYYEFVLRDHEVYNNLLNTFKELDSFYNYLFSYNSNLFYQEFRWWLEQKYKCYNDGSNFLYFKTEEDYIWFVLKYG